MLGQSVEILVPDAYRETHREYREAYVRNPKVRPIGAMELQAKRKDSSLFTVEVSLGASHTPNGFRIISTIRDISQHKQMEEALHRSEERYRRLIEEVKDYAIFMLDPEGRVMTRNEGAWQTRGHRVEEILERHVSMFFMPEDIKAGRPEEELREAAEKGRFETEGRRVRKDGSRFWAHVVLSALREQNHQLLGFTKIARDITERKRASEAVLLEISNRLIAHLNLEDLLSAIAASLRQIKEYDYAGLALYDPAIQRLRVYALPLASRKNLIHEELLLSMENSPAGRAIKARRPLVLNRVHEDGRSFDIPANLIKQGGTVGIPYSLDPWRPGFRHLESCEPPGEGFFR